jgi:hypothetical protein
MKVYWSRCGHGHGNFGDKITPLLLKDASIPVEWAPPEHAELIGVGSMLEKIPETFKGTIWTTGLMNESSRRAFNRARVLAVRGRLTAERISRRNHESIVLGDAGLLCDKLAPTARTRYKLGVIPHFVDIDDPLVKRLATTSTDILVVDICAEASEVLRSIAACETIISSSLHGLIVAHSLGKPGRWLELNHGPEIVSGSGFKYCDYYSVFDEKGVPVHLTDTTSLHEILKMIATETPPDPEPVKANLRRTLAQIKAGVPPLSADERAAKRHAAEEWQRSLDLLRTIIDETIPRNAKVVLADDDQVRSLISGIECLPYTERDGMYWGPPGTAEEAVRELDRQLARGAEWFVIAWPMTWIIERFSPLVTLLGQRFECRHRSPAGQIFQAQGASHAKDGR